MLADAILVLHFVLAAFIAAGLPAVWVGAALGWRWVGHPWFRYLHLGAIALVALESVAGVACPLTVWEDQLRGGIEPQSFVGRWVHRLLYYRAPEWVFTVVYGLWAGATILTLRLVPPRRSPRAAGAARARSG